jgi:excisionase family DNA binding protein
MEIKMVIQKIPLTKGISSDDTLLTTKEASLILNVHENTLRHWCGEGKIRHYRISVRGDRRYVMSDIVVLRKIMHENHGSSS